MKRIESRSDAQHDVERAATAALGASLGLVLGDLKHDETGMHFDGFFEDQSRIVLVEVSAQLGAQKGGQSKKIASDVLKLAFARTYFEATHPRALVDTYIVFVDETAHRVLEPSRNSWLSRAAAHYRIKSRLVTIDAPLLDAVRQAKLRQSLLQTDEAAEHAEERSLAETPASVTHPQPSRRDSDDETRRS